MRKYTGEFYLRIFFAIDLPKETKDILQHLLKQLQSKHKHEQIRWSKPENLHITLQFLKQVKIEDIPTMVNQVREQLTGFKHFNLEIGSFELFPHPEHPRVLSLAVEPHDILVDLSMRIGKGVLASGYEIETRPFRGHLTLAKINKPLSLEDISSVQLNPFSVSEITLFQSEPSHQGSKYTPLASIDLS